LCRAQLTHELLLDPLPPSQGGGSPEQDEASLGSGTSTESAKVGSTKGIYINCFLKAVLFPPLDAGSRPEFHAQAGASIRLAIKRQLPDEAPAPPEVMQSAC